MSARTEPELVALRRLAEELAQKRSEKTTTGHLLAAIASKPSPAADLLEERRLDVEVLLKAARVLTDDASDAITRSVQRAREFANRSATRDPGALHLLFALCQEKQSAAHRALEQCGADVGRIRTSAMQLAMGLAPPVRKRPTLPPPTMGSAQPARTVTPPRVHLDPPRPPSAPEPIIPARAALEPPRPPQPAHAPQKKKARPHGPARVEAAASTSRFALDPKRFPALAQLGRNLTLAASEGTLDAVAPREELVERVLDVLAKRHANCPLLVGPAGVGKTSVVRALAAHVASGKAGPFDDRAVIEIEPSALVAGTAVRGSLAERIAQIKAEVAEAGRVVLFFDEIHALIADPTGDEARSELKAALARGELVCIGATTPEELKRINDADPALARRFSVVEIEEPGPAESRRLLEAVRPALERHHGARYDNAALDATVEWSIRYVTTKAMPDKAVGLLDLAGARARRRGDAEVDVESVAEVVADAAHVPVERLLEADAERYLRLESLLAERVVGHTEPLARIANVLRRNASGFRYRRPIGTFLLLGPTGVGKTETAKAIAECLFFSETAMTRLDMSEYAEPHTIARLVGAPPGYVGHEAGGHLTEAVRRRPYQVLLLDEVEKAHRDVLEAFLQVFDEGRMTDGRGRTVDFTNTVILLTSNLGADVALPTAARKSIGFGATARDTAKDKATHAAGVIAAARAALAPELFNRFDEALVFAPLTREDVGEVARRMIAARGHELFRARGVRLDASEAAIGALLDAGGYDPELGARPMRRAIARLIEAPIAEMLLRGEVRRGDVVTVDVEGGRIVVDAVTPTPTSQARLRAAGDA